MPVSGGNHGYDDESRIAAHPHRAVFFLALLQDMPRGAAHEPY